MTVGSRIKEAREAKGLTQEELGRSVKTTKQTIFKYESGIVTNIPLDRLEQIAAVLSVSAAFLMGWETKEDKLPDNIIPTPTQPTFQLTDHERALVTAYRRQPEVVQRSIDRMLEIESAPAQNSKNA